MEAILAWMTVVAAGLRLLQMAAPMLAGIYRKLSGAITGKGDGITEEDATEWLGLMEKGLAIMPEVWAEAKDRDFHLANIDPKAEKTRRMLHIGQVLATRLAGETGKFVSDDQGMTIAQFWFSGERATNRDFGNDAVPILPGDQP